MTVKGEILESIECIKRTEVEKVRIIHSIDDKMKRADKELQLYISQLCDGISTAMCNSGMRRISGESLRYVNNNIPNDILYLKADYTDLNGFSLKCAFPTTRQLIDVIGMPPSLIINIALAVSDLV
jgi:hypothetical protein